MPSPVKISLSTNWCNRRIEDGRRIAEKAVELGFDALELGFHTIEPQVAGFRSMLDRIPVGSVHAFVPVPISAPQGYPELYRLASVDEEERRIARFHVVRNIEFASEMGADCVVLHAGRVPCRGFIRGRDEKRRVRRGRKVAELFRRELETLAPVLEKHRVTLALENLPYLEGFPSESELPSLCGDRVKGWFDTGHDHVRREKGWLEKGSVPDCGLFAGMHVHDSRGEDDHLAPGEGDIDFSRFTDFARSVGHIVFEPSPEVDEERLKKSLEYIRSLWSVADGGR